ncbi:hypothetical protein N2152v2_000969 [Parachlorella kessleri]
MIDLLSDLKVASWADLDQELVRVVLQALAVCTAWKDALCSIPIRFLSLCGGDEGGKLSNWVIQRQPTVLSLQLWECAVRAVTAVAALQGKLELDFAALPCLKSATFCMSCQLERPASISAASALTYLALRTDYTGNDDSALELLRSLPPSVSCLSMDKDWLHGAAGLLGGVTHLEGLDLHAGGAAPWPAADAPVWAGLRAFGGGWSPVNGVRGDKLKALRRASKLEVLQIPLTRPTTEDLDLLTALPALRKLVIYAGHASDPVGSAALSICRQALPLVEVVLDFELHIQLDDLPALTDLSLWEGRFALQASRPAPQLQRLLSRAEHMAVDVAALPCLRSAEISTSCRHERPASIAAATALTYLALQNLRFLEWDPSTLELLRSLPPSVSCLTMREKWPQEAADVLGGLTSLVGLVLDGRGPLPAEGAPLWAGLRALDCSPLAVEDEEGDVPKQPEEVDFRVQALRRASKLEVLQVDLDEPTIHDADLLTSLPALRRLVIPAGLSAAGMSDPAATAMLNVCCRAMPQVEFLLPVYRVRDEEFFKLMW